MTTPNSPDGKQQYQRQLARQRQLELMEELASGTAPSMHLDLGSDSFAETDGSFLRSRSAGRGTQESTPMVVGRGERVSLVHANSMERASIFDMRRDEHGVDSTINLMDHETGVYRERTPHTFMGSVRRFFGAGSSPNRRPGPFDHHDASADPDSWETNLYDQKQRRASRLATCCAPCIACWSDRRRRRLCLMLFASLLVLIGTILLIMSMRKGSDSESGGAGGGDSGSPSGSGSGTPGTSSDSGSSGGPFQFFNFVTEGTLRKQNTERFNKIMDNLVRHGITNQNAFQDLLSSEYHALRWVAYSDPARVDPEDKIVLQRYALAVFFYSSYLEFEKEFGKQPPVVIGDKQWEGVPNPGWIRKDFWMSEKGHCMWFGVSCAPKPIPEKNNTMLSHYDENQPVYGINITDNNIMGTLPPELKALEQLKVLNLAYNSIQGSFPWQMGKMFQLQQIILDHNQINGTIPDQISFLEGAVDISLGNNRLTGTIPSEINRLYNLRSLSLPYNQLKGTIPPVDKLLKLEGLFLEHNRLTGHLPFSLAMTTSLYDLHLNDNRLSGTIHGEMEMLRHLRTFYAENNKFTGQIPDGLFVRMLHLTEITFQNNQFSGNLPETMGSEQQLVTVLMNSNRITGTIPSTWDEMSSLQQLHLQDNDLTGKIPTGIGGMTALKELWLFKNKLTGIIPTQIGLATSLQTIFMEHNEIAGRVPTELGNLVNLQTLRMFNNKIKGYVPDEVCALKGNYSLMNFAADCAKYGLIMKCDCCTKCY